MEINSKEAEYHLPENVTWLPPTEHPNYRLWANYAAFARERGELTADILESYLPLRNARILDVGFGMGGTALALHDRGANVTAIELNSQKVKTLKHHRPDTPAFNVLEGDAMNLNFATSVFDGVILQDVLEHLPQPERAVAEASRVLKANGCLFLSAPNRWSPLNFISDPHWNLPLVAILPRKGVEFFITRVIRREKTARPDFAALFSLTALRRWLLKNGLQFELVNQTAARRLFVNPKAVVNSNFHLSVVHWLRKLRLENLIVALVNERFGVFNHFINPTWYLLAKKSDEVT